MTKSLKDDCLKRLNYIIGHIKGIQKMIKEDKYCMDIINQNVAVAEAIKKININILEDHLNHCVSHAILGGKSAEKSRVFKELLNIFKCKNKH